MTARFRSKIIGSPTAVAAALVVALGVVHSPGIRAQPAEPAPPLNSRAEPGQAAKPAPATPAKPAPVPAAPAVPTGVMPPPDYVIGTDDVLVVVYWRDKDMSGEVTVRPDGKITLPLVNDIVAAGLTPAQLRDRITEASLRYIEEPNVTVVVRQINSLKVFITGEIGRPGPYPLMAPTTVLQLIALAGGLREYADGKKIVILRTISGKPTGFAFNYKEVVSRKNLRQNIELKPGDTVVVP